MPNLLVCDVLKMQGNATLHYPQNISNLFVRDGDVAVVSCDNFDEQWLAVNEAVFDEPMIFDCDDKVWSNIYAYYNCIPKR